MVIGKKFWPIYGVADYLPADNPGVLFGGTSSGSTITGVSSSIITNIAGLLSAGATVGISGNYIEPGTQALSAVITSCSTSSLCGNTFSKSTQEPLIIEFTSLLTRKLHSRVELNAGFEHL